MSAQRPASTHLDWNQALHCNQHLHHLRRYSAECGKGGRKLFRELGVLGGESGKGRVSPRRQQDQQ